MATADDSDKEDDYDPPNMYTNRTTIPTPTRTLITSDVMMIDEDNEQTVLQQPRRREVNVCFHISLATSHDLCELKRFKSVYEM